MRNGLPVGLLPNLTWLWKACEARQICSCGAALFRNRLKIGPIYVTMRLKRTRSTVDVKFILDGHIVSQNSDIIYSCPSTDNRVPANDGTLDPCMVLDTWSFENHTSLETSALANFTAWSDNNVGSNYGWRVDLCRLYKSLIAIIYRK